MSAGHRPSSQAHDVAAPTESAVFARATAATSQRYDVPAAWVDRYVTIQAQTVDIWVLFGGATVVASETAVSAVAAEVLTVDATTGVHIPAGTSRDFRVLSTHTDLAVISTSTAGFWRGWLSSN